MRTLDSGGYHYSISRHRPDSLLIQITFVGERVEVDVFEDGHMEVSRFSGKEDIVGGVETIFELIKQNQEADR